MTSVDPESNLPLVSREQAELLRCGLTLVGIERVDNVPRLLSFLIHASHPENDGAILPAELTETASQVSKLVIKGELEYMRGLVENNRTVDLAKRVEFNKDPVSKFFLLESLLEVARPKPDDDLHS